MGKILKLFNYKQRVFMLINNYLLLNLAIFIYKFHNKYKFSHFKKY